ncbi:MAG: efflux RND transporter periplasmic adaptor subunit [Campylobacterota bacterium]|nr:efflux RND transporter periplasmic adaptor subunit [Campylobacterota bacterium]
MRNIIISMIFLLTSLNANEVYATFNIEAKESANLAFSSSGIIDEILVDVTSVVKKGDTLAVLQNDDLKAMVEISKVSLKYAKNDYERQKKVRTLIDKSQFDKYAFKYDNAKAELKYRESLLDKTVLKAPFNGEIYEKLVEVGDVVSGQMITVSLKIQSKNRRKLVLEFDQKYYKDVQIGDIFRYKLDGDEKEYEGKISKIYPYTDKKTRKIKAEVLTKDFIVGLFGDGFIITNR